MRISIKHIVQGVAVLASVSVLAACGGGSDAAVGGVVTGLGTGLSVTLQNNNADNLTVIANQGFTFPASISPGSAYSVSVLSQPAGQTCVVGNGAGTIDTWGDDVTNVTVTCSATSSVGGIVAGLAAGNSVWLANNGQLLPIAANGAFAFPGILAPGTLYNVTVSTQPAQQNCVVANGGGAVSSGVMASVAVACN